MRFDSIVYDQASKDAQAEFKVLFKGIEQQIADLPEGRSKEMFYSQLELTYMWMNRLLRDAQILRAGAGAPQAEEN